MGVRGKKGRMKRRPEREICQGGTVLIIWNHRLQDYSSRNVNVCCMQLQAETSLKHNYTQ